MRIEDNIALIESRLLCAAIWGDTKCIYNRSLRFTGFVYSDIDKVGRAFIEYCVSRILGIYRLPQCGYDNYLNTYCFFYSLDEKEVIEACEELKGVMAHVQKNILSLSGIVNEGKVTVVRCLASFQVQMAAPQLKNPNLQEIEIPVNIISSYSYDGNTNTNYPSPGRRDHSKHINIKEKVPIDRIILWDRFVGNGRQTCSYVKSMYDCEHEVLVADTGITGIRKLPRSCFYYSDGLPDEGEWSGRIDFGSNKAVHAGLYKKRPCEYEDYITRFCINSNIKRMEKEKSSLEGM